jgi:hypothetical protein
MLRVEKELRPVSIVRKSTAVTPLLLNRERTAEIRLGLDMDLY